MTMNNLKLAIVGSRGWKDEELLRLRLDQMHAKYTIDLVISGGAAGADQLGEEWARENDVPTVIHTPDWKSCGPECRPGHRKTGRYGEYCPTAGMRRNTLIINQCDSLIAFWDGESTGTLDSINKATKAGKNVWIVYPDGETQKNT